MAGRAVRIISTGLIEANKTPSGPPSSDSYGGSSDSTGSTTTATNSGSSKGTTTDGGQGTLPSLAATGPDSTPGEWVFRLARGLSGCSGH